MSELPPEAWTALGIALAGVFVGHGIADGLKWFGKGDEE